VDVGIDPSSLFWIGLRIRNTPAEGRLIGITAETFTYSIASWNKVDSRGFVPQIDLEWNMTNKEALAFVQSLAFRM
jgi:hypothetical protein